MRLTRDVLVSLLLGAGIWMAIAFGAVVLDDAMGAFRYGEVMILPDSYILADDRVGVGAVAAASLLVAGALYAGLLLGRLSPVGPRLVGLLFLSVGVWSACSPSTYDRILGQPPAWGYTIVLAAPLLVTQMSKARLGRSGILIGPLIWFAIGAGIRLLASGVGVHPAGESLTLAPEGRFWSALGSVLVLFGAGGLVAVLMRAGSYAGAAGLIYAGLSVWALTDVVAVHGWTPLVAAPLWGYALVPAVPMVAVFVRQEARARAVPAPLATRS